MVEDYSGSIPVLPPINIYALVSPVDFLHFFMYSKYIMKGVYMISQLPFSPSPEDSIRIENRINELLGIVHTMHPDKVFPPIIVTFHPCGTDAGWAKTLQYQINLNPKMFPHNVDEYINVIVAHELAHIVTSHIHGHEGIRDHGPEWSKWMEHFGLPADRNHRMDTSLIRGRSTTYPYTCMCPDKIHNIGTRWNYAIQSKGRVIQCMDCQHPLIPDYIHIPNGLLPNRLQHASKVEKAKYLLKKHAKKSVKDQIALLVQGAGLSRQGAYTYRRNLIAEK